MLDAILDADRALELIKPILRERFPRSEEASRGVAPSQSPSPEGLQGSPNKSPPPPSPASTQGCPDGGSLP